MDAVILPSGPRFAAAKVNLALHVVGRRDDGYHLLESLVVFDDIAGDAVAATPRASGHEDESDGEDTAANGRVDRLSVEGRFASAVPAGGDNILLAAATLARTMLQDFGRGLPPLEIHLTKNLPVAAGIGGGSADAAALIDLVSTDLPQDARAALAAAAIRLGADVPMCLMGQPARITGIGETIEPVAAMPKLAMLLVNPGIAVETAAVFRMLARRDNPPMPPLPAAGFASVGDLVAFLSECRNDLALAAGSLAPGIGMARGRLIEAGALFARMSGSGATVFGLFADEDAASRAAWSIREHHPDWWLSRSPATESGPTTEESRS